MTLLVLDEFHRLGGLGVPDPFGRLGRKIMVQNSTLYMVISSQPPQARKILREGLNLLFGQFEILQMSPLDSGGCLKAIRSACPAASVSPFLQYLLMELAQGYPGRLDLLLEGWMGSQGSPEVSSEDRMILDLLEDLLLYPSGELRIRFEGQLSSLPVHRSRRLWVEILTAVAGGIRRVSEVSQKIGRSRGEVTRAFELLERKGLVFRQGIFCRIPDRLFQLWLLAARPLLAGAVWTDPVRARARFRDAVWDWIHERREAFQRPLEERVGALLGRWSQEAVELEGRRVFLPSFKKVTLLSLAKRPAYVAVKNGPGGEWLVIPWVGPLEEGQAQEWVQQLRASDWRNHRKVLIGAHPVEIHARLILQQSKISCWDLHLLNDLLDLYGLAQIPSPGESRTFSPEPPQPALNPGEPHLVRRKEEVG
ncbi:MAG: hypothetical protein HYZ90_01085 [Candidatus Omnitrophica bacterium]|nr:hypothetical protein [Candidatus Omnitrophota bacterium]